MDFLQLAVVAILFRQTNVVWALFVTCTGATEMLWPLTGSDPPAGESEEASDNKVEAGAYSCNPNGASRE
jgi:hypothetical protein